MTPLQRAVFLFLSALRLARSDSRTHAFFCQIVACRIAREIAESLNYEERP